MPLGDSITFGLNVSGGYRTDLWQMIAADGFRADMVGSQFSGPARLGSKSHEGHGSFEIGQIDALVQGWLSTYRPDVVLLHIGTNDVLHHKRPAAAARFSALLSHITAALPRAEVFVATLIPLGDPQQESQVQSLNTEIAQIVQNRAAAGARVQLVDMHAALTRHDLSPDLIHPSASGYSKMAAQWYAALRGVPTTRWEAEDPQSTVVVKGRRMASATASGSGKVGFLISPGSYLEFHPTVATSGPYQLYVRAANGMVTPCSQWLIVNGRRTGELHYPNLGFDRWTITAAEVPLNAGRNTVRLAHDLCNAEIDSVDLMPRAAPIQLAGRTAF